MSDAQSPPLIPGSDGTSIPPGLRIIRMANEPILANLSPEFLRLMQEGKALPSFFELSSEDKKQTVPRLSVWIEGLTTVAQAWILVGANPKRRWVVFLHADDVRLISAEAMDKYPPTPYLELHGERATTVNVSGERVPENRPGWEGHAGIANLRQGNKTQQQILRWRLAEVATVDVLAEEELATFGSLPVETKPEEPTSTD